jgi:hypothetical protein
MNKYSIDSIDLERCRKTPDNIYQELKPCDNCKKLPIPQYKSYKKQDFTFCKDCYFSLNYKEKHLLIPSKFEINFLEKVIISCKNSSCEKEFNINSLQEMIEHEMTCDLDSDVKVRCNNCHFFFSLNYEHNCFVELKRYIENQFNSTKTLTDIKEKLKEDLNNEFSLMYQKLTKLEQNINTRTDKTFLLDQNDKFTEHNNPLISIY